ncbi:uncharacterized protein LOC128708662 [Anopheles marshallii]|uniref:uncharacterized protein LOC128708662 n=1 Tax=Anopheles marshallii TaxID=1521116 RepID=UPI00237C11B3|nr:uncharacterized protein LOC128708662 [Anopheles marshallii]
MRLPRTCTSVLFQSVLLLLVFQCPPGILAVTSSSKLLVRATVEAIHQHYTTITSKQLYLRWEGASELIDELLKRVSTHLTVLVESNPKQPVDQLPTVPELHQQMRVLNLLIVADYQGFRRVVDGFSDEVYDFSGLYTVVVAKRSERDLEIAGAILRTLWTLYIVNAVVLIEPTDHTATNGVRLYTYFPYGEGYCERALPVIWNVYEPSIGFIHRDRVLFPRKLSNFYNCPLVVATFPVFPFIIPAPDGGNNELGGIEGLLLRTLMQRLNFQLQVIIVEPPDWGTAGPRDQSTGASAYVSRHKKTSESTHFNLLICNVIHVTLQILDSTSSSEPNHRLLGDYIAP